MSEHLTGDRARRLLDLPDNAASWRIEQRHLAEALAWLYGREVDDLRKLAHLTPGGAVAASPDAVASDMGTFTPDEAVDIARALLAAAEKARR